MHFVRGWEWGISGGSFVFLRARWSWCGGSIRCDGIGLPTSTAYWWASREEGWVLLQIPPVQMAYGLWCAVWR
eukprot:1662023-Prymnesium_polylepis.1